MTDLVVNGINVELSLWDTPGQEEYDRLRGHVYPDSHLVVICFAIDGPDSLDNVQEKVKITVLSTSTHKFTFCPFPSGYQK